MSNNSKLILTLDIADKMSDYAAKISNYSTMLSFQSKFEDIVNEYHTSKYAVLSTGIFVDRLDSFEKWLPELLINKNKIIPLLVSNMLYGDMYAESIYRGIYVKSGKPELVLSIDQILDDPILELKLSESGDDGPAEARVNAEHWLNSHEAAEVFAANNQGSQTLCIANALLGIHNNFVDCNDHN